MDKDTTHRTAFNEQSPEHPQTSRRRPPEPSPLLDPLHVNAVRVHTEARDTEVAAEEKISPKAGTLRAMVFQWITEAGDNGATGKELGARYAVMIGREPADASERYSVMPRCTEPRQHGFIIDSGSRRDEAIAWVAVQDINAKAA